MNYFKQTLSSPSPDQDVPALFGKDQASTKYFLSVNRFFPIQFVRESAWINISSICDKNTEILVL